ncbi:MAG: glycosyltransferase [Patescibacteria group bacterium]
MNTFDSYTKKRVSYVLVTKNRADFLNQALERCKKLVKPEDELIVVDGASVDNTKEVVKRHGDMVNIFISEPDDNGIQAINKGFLVSSGKYLKQLADDDIIYPESMEKAITVMEENPDIDLLLCGGVKKLPSGGERVVYLPPGIRYGKSTDDVFKYLGPASGTGHLMRRSSIAKAGFLYAFAVNADAELVLRYIKMNLIVRFARINLYEHPIFEHSFVIRQAREHKADSLRLIKKYCSRSFYISFRLKDLWENHRVFKPLRFFVRPIFRKVKIFFKKLFNIKHPKVEFIWDGGFS